MLEGDEVSRLLDILGNRNRRRIIQLLRQKPCFVTEISDRLMISPKAVIEHLQLMEREHVLQSRSDERRRKYYYLSHDIDITIELHEPEWPCIERNDNNQRFFDSLDVFQRMLNTRDSLLANLDDLEHDIDQMINELMRLGKDMLSDESEMEIIISLAGNTLTTRELEEYTGLPQSRLRPLLQHLTSMGIVEQTGEKYRIRESNGGRSH
ncbi:MAG: ArsR family transcriptional regulator [Methanomicrobiaceae archaeon]|nr:ArsR family transcriptional regulator [Methanomicrobiaceae archaeon]